MKNNPSHGARHGPTERQRSFYRAHKMLRKAQKKRHNTILERFQNDPLYRDSLDGMRTLALHTTRSQKRTTLTLRREGKEAETRTRGDSYQTPRVQMDQWISEMTTKKQRRLVPGCTKNLLQPQDVETLQFILKNKFDKDQTNNLKDMKEILIELMQKLKGHVIFLQQPQ